MYRWYRLVFTDLYPTTDIWKYRSMADLLVPWKNEVNRFRIVSNPEVTDFYIGSSGMESMGMMKSFFRRLYDLKLELMEDDMDEPRPEKIYILYPKRSMRPSFSSSLIQNLSNMHTISGREVVTDIGMFRSGKDRILTGLRIGTFSDEHLSGAEKAFADRLMRRFSQQTGIRVKEIRRPGVFHLSRGFEPYRLINLVRVPEDEDEP